MFLTPHHLGIALEYADGGDLSEFIDERAQRGVRVEGAHVPVSTVYLPLFIEALCISKHIFSAEFSNHLSRTLCRHCP